MGRCHLSSHFKIYRLTTTPWNTILSWAGQPVKSLGHAFMCGQYATLIYERVLRFVLITDACLYLTAWSHCCLSQRWLLGYTAGKQENYGRIRRIEIQELFSIAKSSLAGLWDATGYRRCTSNVVLSKEPVLWSLRAAVGKANGQPGKVPWIAQGGRL